MSHNIIIVKPLLLKSLIGAFVLFTVFRLFFYYDFASKCFIRVVPTFLISNWDHWEVLSLLKNSSPEDYKTMCRHVDVIDKNICNGLEGGCFRPDQVRRIYIGNDIFNISLTASVIVHETCHVIQSESRNPEYNELECYKQGADFLKKVTLH